MSSMQKNRYQEMRERHQAEVNDFPLMFAFDARQFAEGLRRLGLRSSDKDKVCALPGTGGFCRKSDLPALKGMFARHHRELQEAIGADPTGRGFIYEMFRTELSNHEYAYTQDVSETLDCLRFCQISDEMRGRHGATLKAVQETLRECVRQNILAPFLLTREKEVSDIMISLFNQEEIQAIHDYNVAKQAQETALKQTVLLMRDLGVAREEAVRQLAKRYDLLQNDAETAVRQYWTI